MPLSLMAVYVSCKRVRISITRMHIWLTIAVVSWIEMTRTVSSGSCMFLQLETCLIFKLGK